jgi:hypothetical protein
MSKDELISLAREAGLDVSWLEDCQLELAALMRFANEVERLWWHSAQRDAVLAALEESRRYVKAHTVHHAPEDGGPWEVLKQIDAAIAQCKGEPT